MAKQREAALNYNMLESVRKFVDIVIRARDLGGLFEFIFGAIFFSCFSNVFDMGDVRNVYELGVKHVWLFA